VRAGATPLVCAPSLSCSSSSSSAPASLPCLLRAGLFEVEWRRLSRKEHTRVQRNEGRKQRKGIKIIRIDRQTIILWIYSIILSFSSFLASPQRAKVLERKAVNRGHRLRNRQTTGRAYINGEKAGREGRGAHKLCTICIHRGPVCRRAVDDSMETCTGC
jgi:hypothetical protein